MSVANYSRGRARSARRNSRSAALVLEIDRRLNVPYSKDSAALIFRTPASCVFLFMPFTASARSALSCWPAAIAKDRPRASPRPSVDRQAAGVIDGFGAADNLVGLERPGRPRAACIPTARSTTSLWPAICWPTSGRGFEAIALVASADLGFKIVGRWRSRRARSVGDRPAQGASSRAISARWAYRIGGGGRWRRAANGGVAAPRPGEGDRWKTVACPPGRDPRAGRGILPGPSAMLSPASRGRDRSRERSRQRDQVLRARSWSRRFPSSSAEAPRTRIPLTIGQGCRPEVADVPGEIMNDIAR